MPFRYFIFAQIFIIFLLPSSADAGIKTFIKEFKPKDYRNYMIRGVVYGRNKNFNKAMADFKKALQMNPKSAKTYFLRGNVYKHKKDLDRAKRDLEKACLMGFHMACKK